MMMFLKRRRERKQAKEVLRHARHLYHMREDIMPAEDLAELSGAIAGLTQVLADRDHERIAVQVSATADVTARLTPPVWRNAFRENVDVIVVAIAVAMAFRAYFFQPFKIPTGSMQPTLYGVHTEEVRTPTLWDRIPLSVLRMAAHGTMYRTYRAKASGSVGGYVDDKNPSKTRVRIGGVWHRLPKGALSDGQLPLSGSFVKKGDLLWQGRVSLGDHLFVNKMVWNFRLPQRGEIMVFETRDIEGLAPNTHYIKRMCGLPNDVVEIRHPHLIVDGEVVDEPDGIARLAAKEGAYLGYYGRKVAYPGGIPFQRQEMEPRELGPNDYYAFGDNTTSSYDSRYWGAVPRGNLVGPAAFVYWPFTKRWGLAD
jgi:signal peptidase I